MMSARHRAARLLIQALVLLATCIAMAELCRTFHDMLVKDGDGGDERAPYRHQRHRRTIGRRGRRNSAGSLREAAVVEPRAAHSFSVILLHGMYCEGDMFENLPKVYAALGGAAAASIRWIFPNAPFRNIHWPGGTEHGVSAWYDYYTYRGGEERHDDIDESHMAAVTEEIRALIDREVAQLGSANRVIIGGNSQGGTVAMHAALSYPKSLRAIIGLSTILMDITSVPPVAEPRSPVFVFTAEHDQEYLPKFQQRCFQRLAAAGHSVTSHVEAGQDHYSWSEAQLHHAARWIAQVVHGQSLPVRYRDHPKAEPVPPLSFMAHSSGMNGSVLDAYHHDNSQCVASVYGELVIAWAWYGDGENIYGEGSGSDVTAQVRRLVQSRELRMNEDEERGWYNKRFGDPAPNAWKVMAVRYRYGGGALCEVVSQHRANEKASVIITPTHRRPKPTLVLHLSGSWVPA